MESVTNSDHLLREGKLEEAFLLSRTAIVASGKPNTSCRFRLDSEINRSPKNYQIMYTPAYKVFCYLLQGKMAVYLT